MQHSTPLPASNESQQIRDRDDIGRDDLGSLEMSGWVGLSSRLGAVTDAIEPSSCSSC